MAWQAWHEKVEYAEVQRHSMLKAIQMLRNRLLSAAWEPWRWRCLALAAGHAQAEDIIMVLRHRSLLPNAVPLWYIKHSRGTENTPLHLLMAPQCNISSAIEVMCFLV